MSQSKFVTAINCMDGRVQLPVIEWMKNEFSVPYIDMITAAGPNGVLLSDAAEEIELIKAKVRVSQEAHGSEAIAIIGHHDCAGNPIPKEEKLEQIKKSMDIIHGWGFPMDVLGLYVNEDWEVERVK